MNSVQTPFSHATPCQPQRWLLHRPAPEHGVPAVGHGTGVGSQMKVSGMGGGAAPPQ